MFKNISKEIYFGIIAGILVGLLVGFFIFRSGIVSSPTSDPAQQTAEKKFDESLMCPVCPCKSWKRGTLPAPEWRNEMKKDLKTNFQGQVQLRWKPVDGTRFYVVYYEDLKGRTIATKNSGTEGVLATGIPLPPGISEGEVRVSVAAANADKQPGIRSEKISLLVRAPVSTVAPIIKEIKVEE